MNPIRTILIIPIILFLTSCGKQDGFLDMAKLNDEVKKGVGIDIWDIMYKTDLMYKIDPDYYTEAMFELGDVGNSDIYREFGLFQVTENGDSLKVNEKHKNMSTMFKALNVSIDTIFCSDKFSDTICSTKRAFVKWTHRKVSTPDYYIDYLQIAEELYSFRKDKIMSEEEFNFLVLYFHVMFSIECQGNKSPPVYVEEPTCQ